MDIPSGKTILSGIQPSGTLHLGNYLGAIKQWVAMQADNTAYYCIVDEHAVTVDYEPAELPSRVLDTAAMYLAAGVDPEQSTIFVQSHVPAHTELAWLLMTQTPYGELSRMTQFKDKSELQKTVTVGLFAYPVLQAADILLYQADVVPVGEDQVQHIELTRDIAKRFNNTLGETFTLPEALVNKDTARIMSLTDPTRKMSKSDGEKSYIALSDDSDVMRKKIMSAVTDTEAAFSFTESGPAVRNLLGIYAALSGEETGAIETTFANADYKTFKESLADLIVEKLTPVRERFEQIRADESSLKDILSSGRERATAAANETLTAAKGKMGLA